MPSRLKKPRRGESCLRNKERTSIRVGLIVLSIGGDTGKFRVFGCELWTTDYQRALGRVCHWHRLPTGAARPVGMTRLAGRGAWFKPFFSCEREKEEKREGEDALLGEGRGGSPEACRQLTAPTSSCPAKGTTARRSCAHAGPSRAAAHGLVILEYMRIHFNPFPGGSIVLRRRILPRTFRRARHGTMRPSEEQCPPP